MLPKPSAIPALAITDVRKVSQITGEMDRERKVPTVNRTESRSGLKGTDLGASFVYKGKLVFLFGDSVPTIRFTADRPFAGDAIAFSSTHDPESGLKLRFVTAADGQYKAVQIPGVSLRDFEVPTGGFSANGHMYAFYTTDHQHSPEGEIMGRSVLARSDDGFHWRKVYDLSYDKLINVSPSVVDASRTPGLPFRRGKVLLMWASAREYRRSSPRLACVPLDQVEQHSAIRFWDGAGWSRQESNAAPVVHHDQVGELSVAYCPALKLWLMTYNSLQPRGILLRFAERPTGPWSGPQILFDPKNGYGKFMHQAGSDDKLSDRKREAQSGGEYAPYLIPSFFKQVGERARIYFVMSTWNPYEVVLMRADLDRR